MNKCFRPRIILLKWVFLLALAFHSRGADAQVTLTCQYSSITISSSGYITSMVNTSATPNRQFCPSDKTSPLLALYDSRKGVYYYPTAATAGTGSTLQLTYPNGSVATVSYATVSNLYFKFVLQDVVPRNGVDVVQWGPYRTNITNLIGETIGVARDTSEAVNFAIGILALNDTTTGGPATDFTDAGGGYYIIHSPDTSRFPVPAGLYEGESSAVGGNGISDVAFYSHPEQYYKMMNGDCANIDSLGRIYVVYHARDRRRKRSLTFGAAAMANPLIAPNHQDIEPLPIDFKGSAIALYACPDSVALLGVIKNIVLNEHLPYPTYAINGSNVQVWIKDPARYTPDVATGGGLFDSTLSYVRQMGFKGIQAEDLGFYWPNRGNKGYIDGNPATSFPFHFTAGNETHKQFGDSCLTYGVDLGRHTVTTTMYPGSYDLNPPSDSLCILVKRILAKGICSTDQNITVVDPLYLNETGPSSGHDPSLNVIKIGKELINYNGVTTTPPYTLLNVTRGYWGTTATGHDAGDTIYKLQATPGYGYGGIIANMELQDSLAVYYAQVALLNDLGYVDWDGEEFLLYQQHGYYSVKRFYRKLFQQLAAGGMPYLRVMGAGLTEGSWAYHSNWNVGSGGNMYDINARAWGIEGKDIGNSCYASFFPATFGINATIGSGSTVQQYENLEAISVGVGVTYMLMLYQGFVEQCPVKYALFAAIHTWENARAAGAFSRMLKKQLSDPTQYFHLQQVDSNTWNLYHVDVNGNNPVLYQTLTRAAGY